MERARHTISEVLPCPLRGSNLILPILRCETNCDVQLPSIIAITVGWKLPGILGILVHGLPSMAQRNGRG